MQIIITIILLSLLLFMLMMILVDVNLATENIQMIIDKNDPQMHNVEETTKMDSTHQPTKIYFGNENTEMYAAEGTNKVHSLQSSTEMFSSKNDNQTYFAEENTQIHPNQTNQLSPQKIAFEYAMVIVTLFLVLGLFGNLMTINVMNRKHFHRLTSSLILTSLSVSDTVLIIMLPFNKKFFLAVLPVDPRSLPSASCKTFYWFWRTAKITSSWLVVLISLERFIAVWLPLRAQVINSKKNMIIRIVLIYLIIGSFNGAWGVVADVLDTVCKPNLPSGPEYIEAAKWMIIAGTLIYSIIPACIVLILNILIVIQLTIQRQKRKYMTETPNTDQLAKTTTMLMTVSMAFIVFVVPISIAHCFTMFLGESIFTSTNPTVVFLREVAQTLEQLNYSINFFLYVLSSERFRQQVKEILCGSKGKLSRAETQRTLSTKTSNLASRSEAKCEEADKEEKNQ